jgi:hypothetical protein
MVNTSPEGHSKERFSTTPVTQSTSKEIALASEIEAMLGTPDDVSLWCSFTFTKLSSPPLTLPGKLFNDKTNGRVKADSVTVSLELVSFFCVLIKDDWVWVSEMVIWKGNTKGGESSIDDLDDRERRGFDSVIRDSRPVSGIERFIDEEELAEEWDQEERKKEEERRDGVTLETASWASNISEVTKSLYWPNNDNSNEISLSPSPLPETSPNWYGEIERADTHRSITITIPDSERSSIDRPTSWEIFKRSMTNPAISLFDSKLKLK